MHPFIAFLGVVSLADGVFLISSRERWLQTWGGVLGRARDDAGFAYAIGAGELALGLGLVGWAVTRRSTRSRIAAVGRRGRRRSPKRPPQVMAEA